MIMCYLHMYYFFNYCDIFFSYLQSENACIIFILWDPEEQLLHYDSLASQ